MICCNADSSDMFTISQHGQAQNPRRCKKFNPELSCKQKEQIINMVDDFLQSLDR